MITRNSNQGVKLVQRKGRVFSSEVCGRADARYEVLTGANEAPTNHTNFFGNDFSQRVKLVQHSGGIFTEVCGRADARYEALSGSNEALTTYTNHFDSGSNQAEKLTQN